MSINILIRQITPLYNKYRDNKDSISGAEAIEIMWDIGDILQKHIDQNNIAPHALFWSVYGNAKVENILKRKVI